MLHLFEENRNRRIATRVYTIYNPKTVNMKSFYLYKCLDKFYGLPKEIQNSKTTLFKKKVNKYLSTYVVSFDSED